jgi:radical SAM protein with 4Fe4S-binding SPASM domain
VENIKSLTEKKANLHSKSPFIELQFIVMKDNEKEIDAVSKLAHELGVNKLTYKRLQAERINFKRFEWLRSKEDILPEDKRFCHNLKDTQSIKFCGIPWEETVIRYSGAVIPCAFDIGQQYQVGNLYIDGYYKGFSNLWNNNRYRNFRKLIASSLNIKDFCLICDKRDNNCNDQINI